MERLYRLDSVGLKSLKSYENNFMFMLVCEGFTYFLRTKYLNGEYLSCSDIYFDMSSDTEVV